PEGQCGAEPVPGGIQDGLNSCYGWQEKSHQEKSHQGGADRMKQTNDAYAKTDGDSPTARQGWLGWGMRLLTVAFLLLVSWLLFHLFKNLDWADVTRAITSLSHVTLLLGVAAALASYFVYTGFELLGRYYVGHHLPVRQVMPVAFVCYAFNL